MSVESSSAQKTISVETGQRTFANATEDYAWSPELAGKIDKFLDEVLNQRASINEAFAEIQPLMDEVESAIFQNPNQQKGGYATDKSLMLQTLLYTFWNLHRVRKGQ